MNDIQGIRRLLQSLDVAEEQTPPFADELWEELDAAYENAVVTPLQPEHDGTETVVPMDLGLAPPARPGRRRGFVAATAAVAAGMIGLAMAGSQLPNRSADTAGPLNPPALAVGSEQACSQYRATKPSISDLVAAIASEQDISLDDVQVARDALDELRVNLAAADGDVDALDRYADGSALLGQVELEVGRGLFAQAGRTLAGAKETIELGNLVEEGGRPPDPCTAP